MRGNRHAHKTSSVQLVKQSCETWPVLLIMSCSCEIRYPGPLPLYHTASDGKVGRGLGTRLIPASDVTCDRSFMFHI